MAFGFNKNRQPLGEDGMLRCNCGHTHAQHSWQWFEYDGANTRQLACNGVLCPCPHFGQEAVLLNGPIEWGEGDSVDTANIVDLWLRERRRGLEPA